MHAEAIETAYLVIGAGAVAMAFVDTLLSETDARVVLVDRRHKPGGHWNDAYPFVGLHQPAAFYGVGSRELSGRRTKLD
jgi:cation diffusion facilitator CzcD-associated flavoprotein CzcO